MSNERAKNPELFIDNDPFQWAGKSITGSEIRHLGGVPQGVQIFQKIPGKQDKLIEDSATVDLSVPGPERFSTQASGSSAG